MNKQELYFINSVNNYLTYNQKSKQLHETLTQNISMIIAKDDLEDYIDSIKNKVAILNKKYKESKYKVETIFSDEYIFIHVQCKGYHNSLVINLRTVTGQWQKEEKDATV